MKTKSAIISRGMRNRLLVVIFITSSFLKHTVFRTLPGETTYKKLLGKTVNSCNAENGMLVKVVCRATGKRCALAAITSEGRQKPPAKSEANSASELLPGLVVGVCSTETGCYNPRAQHPANAHRRSINPTH